MNTIDKLLEGVEVEWKTLGEVCEFQNGFAFQSGLFKDAGLPIQEDIKKLERRVKTLDKEIAN